MKQSVLAVGFIGLAMSGFASTWHPGWKVWPTTPQKGLPVQGGQSRVTGQPTALASPQLRGSRVTQAWKALVRGGQPTAVRQCGCAVGGQPISVGTQTSLTLCTGRQGVAV